MKEVLIATALFFLLLFSGCTTKGSQEGVGLLPPPQGEPKPSPYQPKQAYEATAPGVSTRTLHGASTGAGYRVDLREVIVGPGKRGSMLNLGGGGVLEVLSGGGSLTCAEKRQDLKPGSTLSVAAGSPCTVDNTGDDQLSLRIYVITAE